MTFGQKKAGSYSVGSKDRGDGRGSWVGVRGSNVEILKKQYFTCVWFNLHSIGCLFHILKTLFVIQFLLSLMGIPLC